MRPNKCCCCDLRTGSLILLGVCFYLAVREFGRALESSGDDLIYATISCIVFGFGLVIVSMRKANLLWIPIVYLTIESIILAKIILINFEETQREIMKELQKEDEQFVKLIVSAEFIKTIAVLTIVLFLSTALVLWWFKQKLEEKAEINSQIAPQQTLFLDVQPQIQLQIPQNPRNQVEFNQFRQYPQSQVQVNQHQQTQYSDDPPPYPETKINIP